MALSIGLREQHWLSAKAAPAQPRRSAVASGSYGPLRTNVADALDVMLALELSLPMAMLPLLVIAVVIAVGMIVMVFGCCCTMLLLVSRIFTGAADPDWLTNV